MSPRSSDVRTRQVLMTAAVEVGPRHANSVYFAYLADCLRLVLMARTRITLTETEDQRRVQLLGSTFSY